MIKYIAAPFIFIILATLLGPQIIIDNWLILISCIGYISLYFLTKNRLENFPYEEINDKAKQEKIYHNLEEDLNILCLQLVIISFLLFSIILYPDSPIFSLTIFCTASVYFWDCIFCLYFSDIKRNL